MQDEPTTVIVVETNDARVESIRQAFTDRHHFRLLTASTFKQAQDLLSNADRVLVMAQQSLPDGQATDLLAPQRRFPLVVLAEHADATAAAHAIKAGAIDYVPTTDAAIQMLPDVAARAMQEWDQLLDRERLQEQLRLSERMEGIGRLAGGVAHDFNNLLTIILGFADIAASESAPGSPALKSIEQIRHAATRASDLTKQLLTFARRQAINPQAIDVNNLVHEAERLLQGLLGDSIALTVSVQPALPPIKGDYAQLQQVIANIASNARDAVAGKGKVTVTTNLRTIAKCRVDLPPGQYVAIRIADNGSGMTPEIVKQIFEPFFTTKGKSKGTGLGLATCYGIVKQHHGAIDVESEPGRGSVFTILLPAVEHSNVPSAAPQPKQYDLPKGNETILVVEDESLVRTLTTRVLQSLNYNVLQAVNGEEALKVIEDQKSEVHLLLTDVVMPRIGGFELAKRLRQKFPALKVLYVSGFSGTENLPNDVAQDKAAFLGKPFSRTALANSVRRVLDGHEEVPPGG